VVRPVAAAPGADHQRDVGVRQRRRRLRHAAGPHRPEHRLRRGAGRQHRAHRPGHRRAHGAAEAAVAPALDPVRGLGARRAPRHGARAHRPSSAGASSGSGRGSAPTRRSSTCAGTGTRPTCSRGTTRRCSTPAPTAC
jgi:hypothetical protein